MKCTLDCFECPFYDCITSEEDRKLNKSDESMYLSKLDAKKARNIEYYEANKEKISEKRKSKVNEPKKPKRISEDNKSNTSKQSKK